MYSDNIFTEDDQIRKNLPKKSYSNNYLLSHQKFSSLSKNYDSTHSLPILLKKNTSFAQFIADETYNLQFFHSFKEVRKITDKEKEKKKQIRNFHILPFNIPNSYYSTLNNSKILFYDEKVLTCVTHSSNFALNTSMSLNRTRRKKRFICAHKMIGIVDINRNRHRRYVKREITYTKNEQKKDALCFILQLNTYFNQKLLTLQRESNKINEYYVQSKKVY
jgi:hypothetical protein